MRFWISLIIVVGLVFLIGRFDSQKLIRVALLTVYIIVVLLITLGSRRVGSVTHIGLNPVIVYVRTIQSITAGWKTGGWTEAWKHLGWHRGQMASLGLNVLLLVPLGYLAPGVITQIDRWWKMVLIGFLFSLTIETLQLATKLGWFDVSDLLHNTLGALIGWIIYKKVLEPKDSR